MKPPGKAGIAPDLIAQILILQYVSYDILPIRKIDAIEDLLYPRGWMIRGKKDIEAIPADRPSEVEGQGPLFKPFEIRKYPLERNPGRPVNHQAHCPIFTVRYQQDDRMDEIGVFQHRGGNQKNPRPQGYSHRVVISPCGYRTKNHN